MAQNLKYTEQDLRIVEMMYRQGKTDEEIGVVLCIDRQKVNYLRWVKLKLPHRSRNRSTEAGRVIHLHEQGNKVEDIAFTCQVNEEVVDEIIAEYILKTERQKEAEKASARREREDCVCPTCGKHKGPKARKCWSCTMIMSMYNATT